MTEIAENGFSLYFGLHDGRKADLEAVSRAAIHWADSVRLAANAIDPSATVRIEYVSAHESSLSLNTILDWGETQLEKLHSSRRPRLAATAIGLAIFLVIDAGPTIEFWLGDEDNLELSEDDRKLLEEMFDKISSSTEIAESNRRFFQAVEADPAISSVGLAEEPRGRLAFSVPSSQFAERSGLWEQSENREWRWSERDADVILETPNLSQNDRVWRFMDVATEVPFTAKMRDEVFIETLKAGGISENLRMGIKMQIHIRFKEEFVDGEWVSIPSTIEVMRVTLP